MTDIDQPTAKRAAALATWIALQAIERNPNHFDSEAMKTAELYLDKSFFYAEQTRYSDALNVISNC